MRAFIYCRVSTREQGGEDHYSLENQEQRCRDYVGMKKWRVTRVRKDVASGKNDSREGFQELLEAIRNDKVDVVIVYRLDRLSRNVRDIYDFLDLIQTSEVAFASMTEGFDTTTAMGRAMLGVAAVFAQLTREMIAENTRDGLLRRAEAGHFNGNKTNLFGYDYNAAERLLTINSAEAAVAREVFDWFTEHGWGVEKITYTLNLRGVPSKTGKQWNPSTIGAMLRNRVYCGEVRANGVFVEGRQAAIISAEQFAAAQATIASRKKLPPRSHDSPHLLSGLARCGKCGRRLKIHQIQNEKRKYFSYMHKRDIKVGPDACPGLSKSATQLEAAVVTEIERLAASRKIRQVVLEDVRGRQRTEGVPRVRERDKLLQESNSLGEKFTQWADRLDAGKIDEEQFERQNRRLLERKQALQQRLGELEAELRDEEHLEVSLAEVKKVLEEFPVLWQELEAEEKRELLRSLVEELNVFKTHAELKLLFLEPITVPLGSSSKLRTALATA